jgi:hypothetical protein
MQRLYLQRKLRDPGGNPETQRSLEHHAIVISLPMNRYWHVETKSQWWVVMDEEGRLIAECRNKADATFIAAAPGLLRALKTLLELGYRLPPNEQGGRTDGDLADRQLQFR